MSSLATADGRSLTLVDLLPGRRAVTDTLAILTGAAFMAVMAQIAIPVPPSPVPVTGQTLGVMLIGATLGCRRGMASIVLYALLGLLLPVYAEGGQGWAVLTGPSGGYILGFVVAAGVVGRFAERGADRRVLTALGAFVLGQIIIFVPGLIGLKIATGESWDWVIHNGFAIFIVGGLIKAAIGAAIIPSAWKLLGDPSRREPDAGR